MLRYFRTPNGDTMVLEPYQEMLIKEDWAELSQTELDAFLNPAKSAEELASEAKADGDVYTLNGVDYQVPFMKDDADGLMQVNAAFTLGLTDTVIHFTNGTKMPIAAAEFQDFALWFVTKRNAFFTV